MERVRARLVLTLVSAGIILNLLLIMNPGYYSHDELTLLWESEDLSFSGLHWKPPSQPLEYRPVPRNLELCVLALFGAYPQIVHLFNLLLHLAVGLLVFHLAGKLAPDLGKKFQALTFLLFVVSPLTTFGAGWPAALYDPMYIFFSLLVIWLLTIKDKDYFKGTVGTLLFMGVVFVLSALALLSKETAVILAAYVLLLVVSKRLDRKGIAVLITVVAATAAYAVLRFKSIFHIATESTVGYKVSLGHNVIHNFVQYFLYPFAPNVYEVHTLFLLASTWKLIFVAAIHIFVIVMLCRRRMIYGVWYLAAFFATLLPVLVINTTASHYLYGAAIPLSFALAYLICSVKSRLEYSVLALAILLLLLHGFANQYSFYRTGIQQQKILNALTTFIRASAPGGAARLDKIIIVTEPKSPYWILSRVLTAVNLRGEVNGIKIGRIDFISSDDYRNLNSISDKKFFLHYKKDGSLTL